MMSHPPSLDSVGEHNKINPLTLNTCILIIIIQMAGIWHNSLWLWGSFSQGTAEFRLYVPSCFSTSKPSNNE